MRSHSFTCTALTVVALTALSVSACARRQPPIARPPMPPPITTQPSADAPAGAGPVRVSEPLPVPPEPALANDSITNRSIADINQNSPFQPVYFLLDSSELDDAGRAVATANADLLKKNPSWMITVEGHCDERGTVEYNLALGERRAMTVRNYLISLGIAPTRIMTVSYGNEFPFDPGHDDAAWSRNRRAHFVITSR